MMSDMGEIRPLQGIYSCICLVNGKRYVGSAKNMKSRVRYHGFSLTAGDHGNPHLQRAWNKYGSEKFVWEILELVIDESQLAVREQYWIDHFRAGNSRNVYNMANPVRQRVPSELMSDAHRAYWASLTEDEYSKRIAYFEDPDFKARISLIRNNPATVAEL